MRKRILIPGAAIGGIAVYLISQILSFNLGDISIPDGKEMVSVQNQSPVQTVVEVPIKKVPEQLVLVDIVIDGERFSVSRVTNTVGEAPMIQRREATIDEIVAMVREAEGDVSGTRVRVSRTGEAVASAETRLMEALQRSGISSDEIDRRSRLVE